MKYFIDDEGIHLSIDRPISDSEAVEIVKHIAARVNDYQCDCAACREKRRNAKPSDAAAPMDNRTESIDVATAAA